MSERPATSDIANDGARAIESTLGTVTCGVGVGHPRNWSARHGRLVARHGSYVRTKERAHAFGDRAEDKMSAE
jgi:hypothetical protein